jgi:hypothetical protein
MKLTKVDIAKALGMTYNGTSWVADSDEEEYEAHTFSYRGKTMIVWATYRNLDEAWEEAAEKLLEPLVDYLLGNLDDE